MHFARLWTLQTLFLKLEVYVEKTYSTCEFHTGSPGTCAWLSGDLWAAVPASLFTPLAVDWSGAGPPLRGTEKPTPLSQSAGPLLTSFTVASFVLINPGPSLVLAEFPVTIFSRELSVPFMLPYSKFRCLPCPVGHRVSQRQRYTHTPHTCTPLHRRAMEARVHRGIAIISDTAS